ncbi:MAG: DNA-3-methyladenine glycosylase [Candidatus Saccharibacteria bacterium]|jgi:DNA-3-methyladenine glycosylase II|nr:DNA-3-methyladenine glycosylase [Candidatus Saccharibacteria bacterium]
MTFDDQIAAAELALRDLDPTLGRLIVAQAPLGRTPSTTPYFTNLARSIIGQQVSVAAASAIFGRLQAATGLDPHKVITLSPDELRAYGISRGKAGYIHDLAEHFVKDAAIFDHLERLPDDEVITELVAVKGIGIWTAQMFLMFTLGRLDVFAPDDVGLQRAIVRLYGLPAVPTKAELTAIAERWRPFRTVACWHLWHSLDNAPT